MQPGGAAAARAAALMAQISLELLNTTPEMVQALAALVTATAKLQQAHAGGSGGSKRQGSASSSAPAAKRNKAAPSAEEPVTDAHDKRVDKHLGKLVTLVVHYCSEAPADGDAWPLECLVLAGSDATVTQAVNTLLCMRLREAFPEVYAFTADDAVDELQPGAFINLDACPEMKAFLDTGMVDGNQAGRVLFNKKLRDRMGNLASTAVQAFCRAAGWPFFNTMTPDPNTLDAAAKAQRDMFIMHFRSLQTTFSFFGDNPIGSPLVAFAVAGAYPLYGASVDTTTNTLKPPPPGEKLAFYIMHYCVVRAKLRLRRAQPDLRARKETGTSHSVAIAAEVMLLREELKAFEVPASCPYAIIDDGCTACIDDAVQNYFDLQHGPYVASFKVQETREDEY